MRHITRWLHRPKLNVALAFGSIFVCIVPKLFNYNDSFNLPHANDIFDKESMKTAALLLLLSATPSLLDFLLDMIFGNHNLDKLPELKRSRFVTGLSYALASLYILAALGYFPPKLTFVKFNFSFEFVVWCVRLNTTASLMFAMSTRNPDKFPVWKTSLATLAVASYGLMRYVVPLEDNMDGPYYWVLLTARMFLVSCVHCMYIDWIYAFFILRKWTVSDYCVLFYLLVFTFLTLDFISNSIYVRIAEYLHTSVVNINRLRVERCMINLVIANVMFSVVPGRLAKIEMMELKVRTLHVMTNFNIYCNLHLHLYRMRLWKQENHSFAIFRMSFAHR